MSDRTLNILTAITLMVVAVVLVNPDGVIGQKLTRMREARRLQKQVSELGLLLDSIGIHSGNAAAPQVIYEFSDYECPYCRASEPRIQSWLKQRDDVRLVYVDYPLPSHPSARTAAKAVHCVKQIGLERVFHDSIMGTLAWRDGTSWSVLAAKWGDSDTLALQKCLVSDEINAQVALGVALGDSLGVTGTPAFFSIRGKHLGGIDETGLAKLVR
jgi:protein-disulfide isomerase